MSLRLRLTLLYTSLLGGAIFILGSLVYSLVSVILLSQIDTSLTQAAQEMIALLQVDSSNRFEPRSIDTFRSTENLLYQVWGQDRNLQIARPAGQQTSLDPVGWLSGRPFFNSTQYAPATRIRVLSVPLVTPRGPVGMLQIGVSLKLVDVALNTLASVLIFLAIVLMFIFWLAAWWVTGKALAPLETMTDIATQIINADDLQRRIPLTGSQKDEVGQLIKAFNATLERLEKLFTTQRRFLADVSHELRTPLTVIKGEAGLLRRMGGVDEESLSSIESEVDRLSRLVGDLLLLAQAESGRLPMLMQPVELDTLLLEVFQQVNVLAGDRLQVKLNEIDQIQVNGDRDRLKQVFINLLGNAVQYTPAGGQVNLMLRRVGEQAQVIISDNGPGIPAEDLPHIFQRFYRAEKSRKRSQGTGFGLGLSIAYWIVRQHNGTIDVTSQEGRGTSFSVRLPILKTS